MIRRWLSLLLVSAFPAWMAGCAPSAPIRLMSFNIRYANPDDGEDGWENRRAHVMAVIRAYNPDVLAVQEALVRQATELHAAFPEYEFVGVGREDGAERGEFVPILFRADRFALLEKGHFWLSEHPEQVGSVGWDAALPRLATWVRLQFRTSPLYEFQVVNVHLDHQGQRARTESAKLLRRLVEASGSEPLIILGDFNAPPGSEPYQVLTGARRNHHALRDSHDVATARDPNEGTYHAFTGQAHGGRIDWILYNRRFEALAADVVGTHFNGRYPSDHFPVTATLRMKFDGAPD